MEKLQFKKVLSKIIESYGFKRKGGKWILENEEVQKMIELQKSDYGDFYYINYGFIIKNIELGGVRHHIFGRLSSKNESENKEIQNILNLDYEISDNEREDKLKILTKKYLLEEIENINSEIDILKYLKQREYLYDIPLVVKKYFELE